MTSGPSVTIGIPAYNGARHLAAALDSARAQDYSPLEVIIVDDASTDGTESVGRHYAAVDSRIRYIRRSRNTGAVANFRSVLAESHATYFTWLAQDDVILDSQYIRIMVDYLEAHPEAVACTSDFLLLDYEDAGSCAVMELAELRSDRPWIEARKDLFRWPQSDAYTAIYSMYRRDDLMQIPMVTRRYRGKPTSAWWEMPVLTALAGRGRIVSVAGCLRGKRSSNTSDGWRTYQMASPFDLSILGFWTKLLVLRSAWTLAVAFAERTALIGLALGNFSRANLRRPHDVGSLIATRQRELRTLQRTTLERSKLIASLRCQLANRHNVRYSTAADSRGPGQVATAPNAMPDRSSTLDQEFAQDDGNRGWLFEYFRQTPPHNLAHCQQLNEEIGLYRRVCDDQLRTIDQLHTGADALPGDTSKAPSPFADSQDPSARVSLQQKLEEKEAELQLQAREAASRLALLHAAEAARASLERALEEKEAELQLQAREAASRLALRQTARGS